MGKTKYTVEQGDCLSKIAFAYGLTWQQLWDDPANAELRRQRHSPHVLLPGDVVVIPKLKKKNKSKSTGQKHNFTRKKEQSKLKLRLLLDGEPIRHESCRLEVGNDPPRSGQVNGNGDVMIEGEIEFTIPSDVTFAKLYVGDEPGSSLYRLNIGHLDPHDSLTGMQQRLNNLGYEAGPVDGIIGPRTQAAIRWFQEDQKMAVDGQSSDLVMQRLKLEHEG